MTGLISVERWPIFQLDAVYRAFDVSNFVGFLRSTSTCWPELPWNDQTLPSGSASGKALLSILSLKLFTSFVKLWLACLTARISEMSMSHQPARGAPSTPFLALLRLSVTRVAAAVEQPADSSDLRGIEIMRRTQSNCNLSCEIGGASPTERAHCKPAGGPVWRQRPQPQITATIPRDAGVCAGPSQRHIWAGDVHR